MMDWFDELVKEMIGLIGIATRESSGFLVGMVAALLLGAGVYSFRTFIYLGNRLLQLLNPSQRQSKPITYREKMERLTAKLGRASSEVDGILQEMNLATQARKQALEVAEQKLEELNKRKEEMEKRVDSLKKMPLPAVEYFIQATEKAEWRSARRDYVLFAAGVVVSTIVGIVLKVGFGI